MRKFEKDRLMIASYNVAQYMEEFLSIPKDGDEKLLKEELIIVARVDYGYTDAVMEDIKEAEIDGVEYYIFPMGRSMVGCGYNDQVYSNVVPVETFLP